MYPENREFHDIQRTGMAVVSALVTGVAIGAATTFLANQGNRRKVVNFINSLLEESDKKISDISQRVGDAREKIERTVSENLPNNGNGRQGGAHRSRS